MVETTQNFELLDKKPGFFYNHFKQIFDAILKNVSIAEIIVKYVTNNLKTIIFQCAKHYSTPTLVTRLKVAPNMADQIWSQRDNRSLNTFNMHATLMSAIVRSTEQIFCFVHTFGTIIEVLNDLAFLGFPNMYRALGRIINCSQLAKMKKYIPYMSPP